MGPTRVEGAPRGGGRTPYLVAPLTEFFRLYMSIHPKNIEEHNRSGVPPPQASGASKNQSSWPNKTGSSKRITKISNHAYKNSEKNQIIFIDNLDHKSTIHRISANTPQKNITSNRSPRTPRGTLY